MANKDGLRKLRDKTVINATSKKQETELLKAVRQVSKQMEKRFRVRLTWDQQWKLTNIVTHLREDFPDVDFCDPLPTSSMRPDGGLLSLLNAKGDKHVILIGERKIRAPMICASLKAKASKLRAMP